MANETEKQDKAKSTEQILQKALIQAQKILGMAIPRLLTGKPQVAANSLTHGLTGQSVFLQPEELRHYLRLGGLYMAEFKPIGVSQIQCAQRIIDAEWRLNRAGALQEIVHTSTVILESQALQAANPQISPDTVQIHAQAFAARRQCEGPNTLEKLGRHETRLRRAVRELRVDFKALTDRGRTYEQFKAWTVKGSEACQWYNTLSALAESLVEARRELVEKSVEEITPVDANGDTVTDLESTDSLLCKKSFRVTVPLSAHTQKILTQACKKRLLTDIESTIFPLPAAA
jgi:hypothetical protein